MANDTKGNPINTAHLLTTVKPTQLGKPKADLSINVTKAAAQIFRMEEGQVKVPRKRASAESKYAETYAWFNELEAPQTVYLWTDGTKQVEVTWDEEAQLFHDAEGNQYTGDAVMECGIPDAREVTGSMEALAQLKNAVTWFNNKTGKKLATRFVKATRDKSGRTVEQTEAVYRLR